MSGRSSILKKDNLLTDSDVVYNTVYDNGGCNPGTYIDSNTGKYIRTFPVKASMAMKTVLQSLLSTAVHRKATYIGLTHSATVTVWS